MKNLRLSLVFILVFLSTVYEIKAQSPFAGMWMLDRQKTNTNKDFPEKLKNYKMMVSGNDTELNVKNQVDGVVEIKAAGRGVRTPVTESSRSGGTIDAPSLSNHTEKVNYGGTMALFFTVNDGTYNLNDQEIKVETKQGLVRIRAKQDKSGKTAQFTTIRRMKMQTGEVDVYIREVWKLSEDGKSLRLQRTVETPNVRDEIVMMMTKVIQ